MTCEKGSFERLDIQNKFLSFTLENVTFTENSCSEAGKINPMMDIGGKKWYNFECDPTNCASDSSLEMRIFGDTDCTNDITAELQAMAGEFKVDVSGFECGTCEGQKCSNDGFSLEVAPPVTEAPVVEIGNKGTGDVGGLSTTVFVVIIVAAVGLLACLFAGVWMNYQEKNVEQEQEEQEDEEQEDEQHEDEVEMFVATE